jgi:microcystin degradation protein MlrC
MIILVAGFQRETNAFAPTMATYDSFVRGVGTRQCRTPGGIQS